MLKNRVRRAGAALLVGALAALPAVGSAHPSVAATSVRAHTDRADAALDRAATLFASGQDAEGLAAFGRSRSETGKAVAEAAKLVHTADTPAERAAAARALRLVATAQAEQIPPTVSLLGPAEASAENAIAEAALADTRGREKAIAVLRALIAKGVPDSAQAGIARAIVALSTDRGDEITAEVKVAADAEVSSRTAATLATTTDVSLRGQARAAAILTALKARLPAAAAKGIDRALAAIAAEQKAAAEALHAAAPGMPESVREFVSQVADRAADRAEGMREDRPAPPVPPDAGTPGPPAGPPVEVPAGPSS
jgi:hypothetical protein